MMLISFRSKLTPQAGVDYDEMSAEMERLARASPGFVDVRAYKSDDGERLTLVWWDDAETLRQWATDVRHMQAQRMGRAKWYEYYKLEVAEVVRDSRFTREPAR
jgi:heme-degrading monooxygenase HmoA